MRVESGEKSRARSRKGAIGLMQIMPKTWAELRARHSLGADPYDPTDNILAGTAYIRELYDRYGAPGFLAAYNAGPGRYERHLATGRPLPAETQAYVATLTPIDQRRATNVQIAAVAMIVCLGQLVIVCGAQREHRHPMSDHPADMRQNRSSRTHALVDLSALAAAVGQPVCASRQRNQIAMIEIARHRTPSRRVACFDVRQLGQGDRSHGLRDKSADVRRAGCGWESGRSSASHENASRQFPGNTKPINGSCAIRFSSLTENTMKRCDDELRLRPGRIRDRGRRAARPKTFVGEVMRAARKTGYTGKGFGRANRGSSSSFGRGRSTALALSLRSLSRRVVIKARVVRHRGNKFRSAPLAKHVAYLKRDGITRDGAEARMFDARSDAVDERAFAERCEEDRHHFRFIVSPEDAAEMTDLRAFTRELMADAARDLGTKLDWVAVDHWNTDNPHVHVLVRGRADDGRDLVISRDYISRGFRARAEERVTLELGPRSEQAIQSALEREMEAERWTGLDRALRDIADEGAGIADLRPGAPDRDPELRRLMIGRAAKLERLGLAERVAPACFVLKPGIEQTLRDLEIRGDIIKTMHRAMAAAGREPDIASFALHGEDPGDPVLGRLVARGLHDELKGSAYADHRRGRWQDAPSQVF